METLLNNFSSYRSLFCVCSCRYRYFFLKSNDIFKNDTYDRLLLIPRRLDEGGDGGDSFNGDNGGNSGDGGDGGDGGDSGDGGDDGAGGWCQC